MANYIRYMLRADNEANWKSKNPVLLKGEPGFDMTNNRLKIGDGAKTWTNTNYLNPQVVNNLTTGGTTDTLSAEQGKVLKTLADTKASSATVTNLQTQVNNKADKSTLTSLQNTLNTKADKTTVTSLQTALNNKADKSTLTSLQSTLNNKADKSTLTSLQNTLNTKAAQSTVTSLTTTVNNKADTTTVNNLTTRVTAIENATKNGVVEEAPKTGKNFARCNGAWVAIS